jgi:hypothetical protein
VGRGDVLQDECVALGISTSQNDRKMKGMVSHREK